MKRARKEDKRPVKRSAITEEGRENELIAMAYDLAAERIRDGTASSAEIVHFLKLGSTKDRLEKEILACQKELIAAKTEALKYEKEREINFKEVIEAFKSYGGRANYAADEE